MSCYFRHLKSILEPAGIIATPANRKQIDRIVHEFVSVTYKDCPATWSKLKEQVLDDEAKKQELIARLHKAGL